MKRHPNYKGGAITDPRGYKLVYVGKDHHLSDSRGYAYEHRIEAERKLGRRLRKGEVVHHKIEGQEGRGINRPNALKVYPANAAHLNDHRTTGVNRRRWGQDNPKIKCGCGCGKELRNYDTCGRPRKYLNGHNRRNL